MMDTRPRSIVEAFIRNAERAPGKVCLWFEGEEWTYPGFRERVESFAAGPAPLKTRSPARRRG